MDTLRLKFWRKQSINYPATRPIFAFLLGKFLKEVRMQKAEVVRPELKNGRYSFQELIKYKRSLAFKKPKLQALRILIP